MQQYESSLTLSRPLATSRASALCALFIAGFATFINLYATQPLLPEFRRIFSASELMVSLTVSAPVLAVMLVAPLVGLMADAVGRKRVIVAAILGLAVPTALTATAANLYQLIIWRFLQGLFVPGIIAVAMAYISEESPRRSVGSTMAIYVTGTVVGGFSGRFITGIVAHHWGWRASFVVLGVLTLAGAVATWRILPRARKFVPQNSAAALLRSLLSHLHNPQLLATYAVGSSVLFCMVAAFTYVNFYLADKPFYLGPAALAMIFAVYLVGAAITPVAGRILDRVGYRSALMGATGIVATGMLLTLVHYVPVIICRAGHRGNRRVYLPGGCIQQCWPGGGIPQCWQGGRSCRFFRCRSLRWRSTTLADSAARFFQAFSGSKPDGPVVWRSSSVFRCLPL